MRVGGNLATNLNFGFWNKKVCAKYRAGGAATIFTMAVKYGFRF